MKYKIYTQNNQDKFEVTSSIKSSVKKAITKCLEEHEINFPCEISLTFVDNKKIKELNAQYRNKDTATDVLSFPMFENGELEYDEESGIPCTLGDIVISLERAHEQAKSFGHTIERECAFLAVHSVLHLLGFDHEQSEEDETYMNDTCEDILSSMGLYRNTLDEMQDENAIPVKEQKTLFISLIGKPNVGKSTLLNNIIGEKVAAVSKKPQTTRNRITGIHTVGEKQYVFIDTPGLHKPKSKLGEFMVNAAKTAIPDADAVVFVTEVAERIPSQDIEILESIKKSGLPCILVINKTDICKKDILLVTIDKLSKMHDFVSIIPTSALTGENVDIILKELEPYFRNEPWYFAQDAVTDQSIRNMASEIIREKLLRILDDEIPHGTAVTIEDFEENSNLIKIRAEIYCEKEAHKKIIIGKNGATLKKAATFAREDLEELCGKKVFLDLWVKVKENWRDSQLNIERFGFKNDD